MRLTNKFSIIFKALGIEICILALIGLVFLFQFNTAKSEFVTKTRAISETIGDLAIDFYSEEGIEPTSGDFYLFLDKRLGRKKLFNTFEISPKFFSVVFNREGFLTNDYDLEEGYSVKDSNGILSVLVPFSGRDHSEYLGLVKIDSDTSAILKKVFADNYLLYAAMLIVLNNQAFIFYLLTRRKREVVFEKGYLKEHSIGALKIMHKVLGDIIEDHQTEIEPDDKKKSQEADKNVISISDLADKRKG
jgi:signal peptidase I